MKHHGYDGNNGICVCRKPAKTWIFFCLILVLRGGLLQIPFATGQSTANQSALLDAATALNHPAASGPVAKVLSCPTFDLPMVASPAKKTKHRVILSWTASSSDAKHPDAVGYCIYRRKGEGQPFELINVRPFLQTRCMDDWVENGKHYDYEVLSISATETHSDPSNVASAVIPNRKASTSSERPAPLCRSR